MDEVESRERLLCAYTIGRDGMIKLGVSLDEEQLEVLIAQKTLSEPVVFLDSYAAPVLIVRGGNIQFCAEDGLGEKLDRLLEKRRYGKEREDDRYYG